MIWSHLAAGLAGAAAIGAAYYAGVSAGQDQVRAEAADRQALAVQAGEAAASAAAAQIARLRIVNQTIRQEVEREIQTRTVYRDCEHTADQLQRLNAALAGAGPQPGAGGAGLPTADAAGR